MRAIANQREFRRRGSALIHHDLSGIDEGVVRRKLRVHGCERETELELAHCCVSCTLREDLLPLLMELAGRPSIERTMLELDPLDRTGDDLLGAASCAGARQRGHRSGSGPVTVDGKRKLVPRRLVRHYQRGL